MIDVEIVAMTFEAHTSRERCPPAMQRFIYYQFRGTFYLERRTEFRESISCTFRHSWSSSADLHHIVLHRKAISSPSNHVSAFFEIRPRFYTVVLHNRIIICHEYLVQR